jgi:DNA modification methylase
VELFFNGQVTLLPGDCREMLKSIPDNSVDSGVMDPPYALVSIAKRFGADGAAPAKAGVFARGAAGFMGKKWDTGEVAFDPEFWRDVMRVLKPGAHLAAFSGTRTYHRMACAIEDAGFEIRDQIGWAYGSGFPKSHDVSKGIDKALGAVRKSKGVAYSAKPMNDGAYGSDRSERDDQDVHITEPVTPEAKEWDGWGTALKPSWEPICLARKPLSEKTVAANVLKWGTGAINIDGCRVGDEGGSKTVVGDQKNSTVHAFGDGLGAQGGNIVRPDGLGRWPANIVHDGSDEVVGAFPESGPSKAGNRGLQHSGRHGGLADIGANIKEGTDTVRGIDDSGGSAARFFYTAKADAEDRLGSKHPTVKPVDLIEWLERLITPPGGTVLDCFAGTGTAGEAAFRQGFRAILMERETEYQADIRKRMALTIASTKNRKSQKRKAAPAKPVGGMFGDE